MPDPENVPDPERMRKATHDAGATLLVVNSGRFYPQGLSLFSKNRTLRQRSIGAFKDLLGFGGYLEARVALGAACRGREKPGATAEENATIAEDIFRELAEYAERLGTVIMLEPSPLMSAYINTTSEAVDWVKRINSPAFNLHLDTENIRLVEPSFEYAIRAAEGRPDHIHLHDKSHWPPGLLPEENSMDWPLIARLLRESGFEGSGGVALAPEGDIEVGARQTAAFLRRLFGDSKQGDE